MTTNPEISVTIKKYNVFSMYHFDLLKYLDEFSVRDSPCMFEPVPLVILLQICQTFLLCLCSYI